MELDVYKADIYQALLILAVIFITHTDSFN